MPTLGFGKFIRDVLTSLILAGSFAATPDIVQAMKLVRYRSATGEKPGLFLDGEIFDLSGSFAALNPRAPTLNDIEAIATVPAKALTKVARGAVLGPPLRGIGKIIGVGLNYRDHAEETGLPLPKEPTLFLKATSALCGPADDLVMPREARSVDWEVELGVVIGKPGVYIAEREALDHVLGYCVGIDFSERDFQFNRGGQGFKGKSADTFAPLGARHDFFGRGTRVLHQPFHEPAAGRRDSYRHAGRRGPGPETTGLLETRRCRDGLDRMSR
jgi:hypothetical protein